MNSLDFFFADHNGPFLVAMAMTLLVGLVEVASMTLGLGISDLLDDFLPDSGLADSDLADSDLDPDVGADGNVFADALAWLNVGRVPLLILLLVALGLFSIIGFGLQLAAAPVLGRLLPAFVAAPLALAAALPATRAISRLLARILPREESYAVKDRELLGAIARISLGPVDAETPGKARVRDQHGNTHFVRVRAANAEDRFEVQDWVLLVVQDETIFEVITAPRSLRDDA